MSDVHRGPPAAGGDISIDLPHHEEMLPIMEITASGKNSIPVLIAPILSEGGPGGALTPTLSTAFRGLLVLTHEDENDPKVKRKKWLKEMRGWLMVLATLAASVTYQAALNPPGGFWQDNGDDGAHHVAGNPVLHDMISKRYLTFYYFNATAFVTSLVIIILLMNERYYHTEGKLVALIITIFLDLISLMGAYVAGSTRDVPSSIYVIVLTGFVFIYVVNIARILPNLCFFVLYQVPYLYKLANKGWLPVTAAMKERVKKAKEEDRIKKEKNQRGSSSGSANQSSCCSCGNRRNNNTNNTNNKRQVDS